MNLVKLIEVVNDENAIDKGIFIRALTEVRMRNPGSALAQYIESYITVQVCAERSLTPCGKLIAMHPV